jgi:hypothetical protein
LLIRLVDRPLPLKTTVRRLGQVPKETPALGNELFIWAP